MGSDICQHFGSINHGKNVAESPQTPSKKSYPPDDHRIVLITPPLCAGLKMGRNKETHIKASIVPEPILRKVQGDLDYFVSILRSFAPGQDVDQVAFDMSLDDMTSRLEALRVVVEKITDTNSVIRWQLVYAQQIFEFMKSNHMLDLHHSSMEDKIHALICSLARINTMLLALFDLHGTPDPSSHKYEEKLMRYFQKLSGLRRIYSSLECVDKEDKATYELQYSLAETTLNLLRSFIPEIQERGCERQIS